MRWRRKRRPVDESVRSAMGNEVSFEAARQVVVATQQPTERWSGFGHIDALAVVHLGRGWSGLDVVPGIEMRWRQGNNLYGLLMPMQVLADQAGSLEEVPIYLQLAVNEPHGEVPHGTRLWFQSLPSGPY